jgi:hypothetical protein
MKEVLFFASFAAKHQDISTKLSLAAKLKIRETGKIELRD